MQVAYIMKKAVFLRIVLTAAVLALLLSGCRFVRVEEEERKPVTFRESSSPVKKESEKGE